jgi:hypothetical protein
MHFKFFKCNTLVDISFLLQRLAGRLILLHGNRPRHQIDNDQNVDGRTGKGEEVAGLQ